METALPGRRRKEVCYVYQKLTRTLAPRIGFYFAVMLAFAGVTALLGQADDKALKISELKNRIADLKQSQTCPVCGEPCGKNDKFCRSCGDRL